ncbi:unnamed protein product [Bursaphelenchus xylophilus]|uniref:(pine wood nematode) hypothetical protein n=1 Tax=Bursaphelenchus xylophilus TaxID=6326 RepID=A0A1I7SC68_BURXY|nr:unnamed protein product [Bursaphelenchus xylophilus]CAG9094650.1 unnamed protein product [Bursaphelenchus xylophilus]
MQGTTLYIMVENPLFYNATPLAIRLMVMIGVYVTLLNSPLAAVHFWYRYNAMCKRRVWTWKEYCRVYAVFVFLSTAQAMFTFHNAREDSQKFGDRVDSSVESSRYVMYDISTLSFIICLVYTQSLITMYYALICYFGCHIYQTVRNTSVRTVNTTQTAQSTLVKVMTLQVGLIPSSIVPRAPSNHHLLHLVQRRAGRTFVYCGGASPPIANVECHIRVGDDAVVSEGFDQHKAEYGIYGKSNE